ncbi:MAG: hypothetical protein GTO45_29120 [Candidatus Aminicenantes bacterium]|nr:hypothetical protein [Candidatus Aminicenantes bacterium]NIM82854.1 hypothetical protein [Candidatus Aminicenantes bacterium]NIN22230.1 hypothetical protein [Candidatus Aminicenantes bacterium]NIN45998.1 hypothetical protein [Candidatus Aminicenantes bacterium]NIN88834.1 hypothetical protein [Candidatus Aminicenantes bacterium]
MKPKVLKKRLVLNKKTIASLGEAVMNDVYGGHDSSPTCPIYKSCPLGPLSVCICRITDDGEECTTTILC